MKFGIPAIAVVAFLVGTVSGIVLSRMRDDVPPPAQPQETANVQTGELAALPAEIKRIQEILPDQAHAMQDVGYHFTNLWFAANQGHWPLAQFYFNETRSHLRWAVRIIPVRKDSAGYEIKLADILEAMENSALKRLEEVIKAQDKEKFLAAYEFALDNCYACHKASDKSFLRPCIPSHSATAVINFDPNATWPK